MTAASLALPATFSRYSTLSRIAILLFVWLLPFHSVSMALLVGPFSLPLGTVRVIAAWKEMAVLVLLAWVTIAGVTGRRTRTAISAPDVAVASMLGIAVLYLLTESTVFKAGVPRSAELYGFRDSVFFLLLYWIGRSLPELAEDERVVRHLFAMGIVISVLAVLERLFVDTETLLIIGVATYMQDFLGLAAFTEGTGVGLPQNYWTLIGGRAVRRAGSVFLHSQGMALPFLLLIPAGTAWVLARERRPGLLTRLGYAVLWTGLLLTITRMTILSCGIQLTLFYLMVRKPEWAMGTVIAGIAAFTLALAVFPGMAHFVWQTLTWQELSSESHIGAWTSGAIAFLQQPWGHGLGTTEAAAARSGMIPITGDNMFLSYAVQLGIVGLAAHLAVLLTIMARAWRVFRRAAQTNPSLSRLGAILVLTTLGILFNGVTSLVFGSTLLAYLYALLAGALVAASSRSAARQT
ncbi:MAG TPA: hypothetical protein VFZ56_08555 [Gemmatimonadaceae bacterium]